MSQLRTLDSMVDDLEVELEAANEVYRDNMEYIETLEKFIYDTCKSWPEHLPDPKRIRTAEGGIPNHPH